MVCITVETNGNTYLLNDEIQGCDTVIDPENNRPHGATPEVADRLKAQYNAIGRTCAVRQVATII